MKNKKNKKNIMEFDRKARGFKTQQYKERVTFFSIVHNKKMEGKVEVLKNKRSQKKFFRIHYNGCDGFEDFLPWRNEKPIFF